MKNNENKDNIYAYFAVLSALICLAFCLIAALAIEQQKQKYNTGSSSFIYNSDKEK